MRAGIRGALALAFGIGALAVTAVPASAADGSATAERGGCSLSQRESNGSLGADYVYSLKVRGISCDAGKELTAAFNDCRHDNGGANGKCKRVAGYRCKQRKLDSSPTLLQAKATCKKGSNKFKLTLGETL